MLFVAEKMAALDVVKKRLDQSGLGHFVFELHSTKAKKNEVLDSLRRRLERQEGINAPKEITDARREVERLKQRLTTYANLLNSPMGHRELVQEIFGPLNEPEECDDRSTQFANPDNVEEMTRIDLERSRSWSRLKVRMRISAGRGPIYGITPGVGLRRFSRRSSSKHCSRPRNCGMTVWEA